MTYLKQLFYEADRDHSGFLSKDEIYNLFNLKLEIEITKEELDELMGTFDEDGDAQINIDEFISIMSKSMADSNKSEAKNTMA